MNTKDRVEWISNRQWLFVDLVRLYLGMALFVKGIFFLLHPERLAWSGSGRGVSLLIGALPYVHIIGGLLLAAGLWARWAALIQIPILAGAMFLVAAPNMSGLQGREAFELTGLVLLLLTLVALWGAGPYSLSAQWSVERPEESSYQRWIKSHAGLFMDILRVCLGAGLFLKGFYIVTHWAEFAKMTEGSGPSWLSLVTVAHYVAPAHIVGGLLLALGLVARPAAMIQIPPLVGALFWIHLPRYSMLDQRENIELSALVLFLLVLMSIQKPGRLSLDRLLEKEVHEYEAREEHAASPTLHPGRTTVSKV